jgi:hypothetical protein
VAEKSGVSDKLLLRWVNMADLFRIKRVGEEYADLLEAAGVDSRCIHWRIHWFVSGIGQCYRVQCRQYTISNRRSSAPADSLSRIEALRFYKVKILSFLGPIRFFYEWSDIPNIV